MADELFRKQEHPYTQALMSAIPIPDPLLRRQRVILRGDVPSPVNPPTGCRFHPRCQLRQDLGAPAICAEVVPPLIQLGGDHQCACHFRQPPGTPTPPVGGLTSGLFAPVAERAISSAARPCRPPAPRLRSPRP